MSQESTTATEERALERTYWAMKQMPAAVIAARDGIMADWHPDQEPMSIWKAVNDAISAAALSHEHVTGDRQGESAESGFLAVVQTHVDKARASEADPEPQKVMTDAVADWRKSAELEVEKSMAAVPTYAGACRLFDAVHVGGAINVVIMAKTVYGEAPTDQIWALGEGDSKKLLARRRKRNGDRLVVHASRDGECTVITAVVEGLLPVDLMKLLV